MQSRFVRPKIRPYKTNNYYALLMTGGVTHDPVLEKDQMCIRDSLLSFLCLFKKECQKQSYLARGGVGEKALLRFLSDRPNIKPVYLCLDSDQAGSDACSRLAEFVPEGLTRCV